MIQKYTQGGFPVFVTLSLLLAAACLLPGSAKLLGLPRMREAATHFGIPWPGYRLIALPELAAALGVVAGMWWHPIGISAAAGMTALLLGALATHRRAGDGPKEMAAALVGLALVGAYLAVAAIG